MLHTTEETTSLLSMNAADPLLGGFRTLGFPS